VLWAGPADASTHLDAADNVELAIEWSQTLFPGDAPVASAAVLVLTDVDAIPPATVTWLQERRGTDARLVCAPEVSAATCATADALLT
jgi:hypothetical protein